MSDYWYANQAEEAGSPVFDLPENLIQKQAREKHFAADPTVLPLPLFCLPRRSTKKRFKTKQPAGFYCSIGALSKKMKSL